MQFIPARLLVLAIKREVVPLFHQPTLSQHFELEPGCPKTMLLNRTALFSFVSKYESHETFHT